MTFVLNKAQYVLAKTIDYSEMNGSLKFNDVSLSISMPNDQVSLFEVLISEEVDRRGLSDDQNKVLPIGRRLYDLYDTVYAQIPGN